MNNKKSDGVKLMKKILLGILIGAALTFTTQAYAAVGDTVNIHK
jgi:hypothetical protein